MKKKTSGSSSKGESPSRLIDARIQELDDWRAHMLSRLRALIKQAAPGAQMKDPRKRFNSSLEGNAWRAIDFHEGDKINEVAFKALIREAVTLNTR